MTKAYYVTTPIYYVNDEPHIGTAYTTVAADVLARAHRLRGEKVFFLTGSDEHGRKMERAAREKGLEPKELCDRLVVRFKELWAHLDIQADHFIRTTDPAHEKAVQHFFKSLAAQGDLYKAPYKGWYCTPCERYLLDATKEAHACATCKRPGEWLEEENYFFRASKYAGRVMEHLKANPDWIAPETRRNEVMGRLQQGVEDVSVTRSTFKWGVPMPGDEQHILWVWFDALLNYISAAGYPDDTRRFNDTWPADVHLIGKDILWFHCVIWPCMLLAGGIPLPRRVFAHGWWTMNTEKISKSAGNMIYPRDLTGRFGVDALRYFMLRETPFGNDGDFNHAAFLSRYQNDLGNDLGNLAFRVLSMIEKYFEGKIPAPDGPPGALDRDLSDGFARAARVLDETLDRQAFSTALESIWTLINTANKYVEETKPWALHRQPATRPRLAVVLYNLAETLRGISHLLDPFLPGTAARIRESLGVDPKTVVPWPEAFRWGILASGTAVRKTAPLFPKYDPETGRPQA